MADKTLFTRIINKNDSLAKWTANDPVLKQGEIALAYIETTTAGGNIVPTYLMKVGHGNKKFSELKWLAAPASDVFAWAKKENITDNEEISNVIAQASTNKVAIEGLDGRIDALEGLVGGNVGDLIKAAIEGLDVEDTAAAGQFVTAVSETDGKITVSRAALKASDIPTLGLDKIDGLVARFEAVEGDVATIKSNIGAGTVDSRIATAKQEAIDAAGLAADGKIQALDVTVSGMGAGKTIATLTETDGKIAATFQDISILKSQISDFSDADYDENGAAAEAESNAKAYAKEYADGLAKNYDAAGAAATAEENAKKYADDLKDSILGEGISETFDTLKEIETWINGAGVNATELTEAIAEEAAIRGEADTALGNRITELEKIDHDHSNKDVLDGITSAKVTNWDDANSKKHEHSNKTVLDGITSAKVTAWDEAEQNAKAYADEKKTEAITAAATDAENKIKALDVNDITGFGAGKTLATLTETDGKIAATFQEIKITKSQVTDFGSYDASGSADQALIDAKAYTDEKKTEAIEAAKDYTDKEVKKVDDKVNALTTDNIAAGTQVWIFDCGTSSTVIE